MEFSCGDSQHRLARGRRNGSAPVSSASCGQTEDPPMVRRAGGAEEQVPGWGPGSWIRREASGPCGNWGYAQSLPPGTHLQGDTGDRKNTPKMSCALMGVAQDASEKQPPLQRHSERAARRR